MSESAKHMEYVRQALNYIHQLVPQSLYPYICTDLSDNLQLPPKMIVDGYRPDVYLWQNEWHIIGEAKTDKDIDRDHSIRQYKSYLEELDIYGCKNSYLIISCSLSVSPSISNFLRNLKKQKQHKANIIILNEIGLFRQF